MTLLVLPKLRLSSDPVFGLWNRVPTHNGQKTKTLMSVNIVNEDVEDIIKLALKQAKIEEAQGRPSTEFDTTSDRGKALLGNSNFHSTSRLY